MRPWERLREHLRRMARDDESGAAMTEFALIFPLQLMITLVVMQFALICHAYLVVGQASFMGARAAAVADGMTINQQDAARRVVARTLAVLTTGTHGDGAQGTPPTGGDLRWTSSSGSWSVADDLQREAYGHLDTRVQQHDGYVACTVEFDYVLWIPVANRFFAGGVAPFFFGSSQPNWNEASQQRGLTCTRVRRVGFVATPWRKQQSSSAGSAPAGPPGGN